MFTSKSVRKLQALSSIQSKKLTTLGVALATQFIIQLVLVSSGLYLLLR